MRQKTAFPRRDPLQNEQGAIVIVFAVMATVLFGFAALAVDSGFQAMLQGQLQNVADAAAHGGAVALKRTWEGIDGAYQGATAIAAANLVGGKEYVLENDEVDVGIWDPVLRKFTPDDSNPRTVNAVQVRPRYTVVPLAADVLVPDLMLKGRTKTTAARFPVASGCALPLAVPSCKFAGKKPEDICNMDLIFNADGADSAGWANVGGSPSASSIRSAIADASDGSCDSEEDTTIADDQVRLNNGSVANALKELTSAIQSSSTTWDASFGALPRQETKSSIKTNLYGRTLEGLIYVYKDPKNCSNTKFSGSVALEGYASAVIYDVVDSGNVGQRKIKARIVCDVMPSNTIDPHAKDYGTLGGVAIVE